MSDRQQKVEGQTGHDYREYLRKTCYLPLIAHEKTSKPLGNVLNLSTSGLFIVTEGFEAHTELLKARFIIPDSSRSIEFLGKIIYVRKQGQNSYRGAGIRIVEIKSQHHKALRNYVLNHVFNETLKDFQKRSNSSIRNLKPFNGNETIDALLASIVRDHPRVQIFRRQDSALIPAVLEGKGEYHLTLTILERSGRLSISRYDHIYIGVTHQGANYFFESAVKYLDDDSITITKPDLVYFEERRVETRSVSDSNANEREEYVHLQLADGGGKLAARELIDFNSSGISFIHSSDEDIDFSPGDFIHQVNIKKGEQIQPREGAKVAHVTPIDEDRIKIGIEFQVQRKPCEIIQIESQKARKSKLSILLLTHALNALLGITERFTGAIFNKNPRVHVVQYDNKKGEKIVAILNATFDLLQVQKRVKTPVVIIPPAFARRKETTCLLASTIVETFRKNGKHVLVLRFDGIRTVGESHNDEECNSNGSEMIHHTLSQLVDDIETTIDYVRDNPLFIPDGIIVISFSMASVAARRAVRLNRGRDVCYWISCMGASDPDDLIRNSTGGIDYLKLYDRGEKQSVKQVLGHMIDVDRYCADLTCHKMAYLQDARDDMASINVPVTWIYGRYDYWINRHRVQDIMSIQSEGERKIFEVLSGHIVKTSEEAINIFKIIAESIWSRFNPVSVKARLPSMQLQARLEKAEWSRVKKQRLDYKKYWRSYLLGDEKEDFGFDIITLTDEYHELMKKQVALLDIAKEDISIDLGGGTGNFIQTYIESQAPVDNGKSGNRIPCVIMVDFVREALSAARTKHKTIGSADLTCKPNLGYVEANLDLNEGSMALPFKGNSVDKILASLFVSYIKKPGLTLNECFRVLKPGGKIVVSSLKPDIDMSKPIQELIQKIKTAEELRYFQDKDRAQIMRAVQIYINSAAYLLDLEEEKVFRFYNADELKELLACSRFKNIQLHETFGQPAQGVIAVGYK
jgi:ubiquinone/menaquinone biosynthesis C-methylase UbiE/dienelactone hydrolase